MIDVQAAEDLRLDFYYKCVTIATLQSMVEARMPRLLPKLFNVHVNEKWLNRNAQKIFVGFTLGKSSKQIYMTFTPAEIEYAISTGEYTTAVKAKNSFPFY